MLIQWLRVLSTPKGENHVQRAAGTVADGETARTGLGDREDRVRLEGDHPGGIPGGMRLPAGEDRSRAHGQGNDRAVEKSDPSGRHQRLRPPFRPVRAGGAHLSMWVVLTDTRRRRSGRPRAREAGRGTYRIGLEREHLDLDATERGQTTSPSSRPPEARRNEPRAIEGHGLWAPT